MILITTSTTTLASVWGALLAVEVRMEGEGTEAEKGGALPWPPSTGVTDGIWPGKLGGGTAVPAPAQVPDPEWYCPPSKGSGSSHLPGNQ